MIGVAQGQALALGQVVTAGAVGCAVAAGPEARAGVDAAGGGVAQVEAGALGFPHVVGTGAVRPTTGAGCLQAGAEGPLEGGVVGQVEVVVAVGVEGYQGVGVDRLDAGAGEAGLELGEVVWVHVPIAAGELTAEVARQRLELHPPRLV